MPIGIPHRTALAAALAIGSIGATAPAGAPPKATVTTKAGAISGARNGQVDAFLGLPYAAAPVGVNRWRAPQPIAPWHGVRSAKQYGASCMQPYPSPTFGPYTREFLDTPKPSEDCLFLNVWRPANARKLPVLVWIHGGGFLGGSGALSIYSGAHLATKQVIVVSINYRVGPLGYLALPGLSAESGGHGSGNYGLLDQIAALKWIQSNIAAFGGDPARVTIAGQSAGAASVNDLVASPLASGLFQRAIAESGSGMGENGKPLADAEREGVTFANYLGATSVAALRALPASTIQSAVYLPIAAAKDGPAPPKLRFRPVIDGWALPEAVLGTARPASNVPLLTGFNADEDPATAIKTAADLVADARTRYGAHADALLALYPHATDAEAQQSARLMARDRYLASLTLWTNDRVRTSGQVIYRYKFGYAIPAPTGAPSFGAFHTAEVPYVFGILDTSLRPYTAQDQAVAEVMQNYWLSFVRNGNPNGQGLPKWAPVASTGSAVMVLGPSPQPGEAVSSQARLDAFAAFVRAGGVLTLF